MRTSTWTWAVTVMLALWEPTIAQSQEVERWKSTVQLSPSSEFDRSLILRGRKYSEGNFYGHPAREWHLATLINKSTGKREHALVFFDAYDGRGWRFWKFANTDEAESLRVTVANRKVGSCGRYTGCSHYEDIVVDLDERLLERRAATGLRVRLTASGDASEHVVTLSRDEIADQLAASRFYSNQVSPPPDK